MSRRTRFVVVPKFRLPKKLLRLKCLEVVHVHGCRGHGMVSRSAIALPSLVGTCYQLKRERGLIWRSSLVIIVVFPYQRRLYIYIYSPDFSSMLLGNIVIPTFKSRSISYSFLLVHLRRKGAFIRFLATLSR